MNACRSVLPWACAVVLGSVGLAPSWAQGQAPGKSPRQAAKVKVPPRPAAADLTAKLQAQAAAEAALANRTEPAAQSDTAPTSAMAAPQMSPSPMPAVPGGAATFQQAGEAASQPPAAPPIQPELLIAQQIHVGHLPCELGASVRIEADAAQPGFFNVHAKGLRYRMFPVQTSTGALRLEDKKAGAVWLQLANKSMLMDQKRGRRLADECAHPDQVAYAETMKTHPPPSLIDTKGMGR